MARKKSSYGDETTEEYSDAAPPDAEAEATEAPEGEELTDAEIKAYQPCATPPVNPPSSVEIAQGISAEKAKKEEAPVEGEGEPPPEEVEIQEDGMYRVGQDCNVKGRAFTKGESIFLEDDEVETLQNAGVKLMPPDRDPHEMGPKARKMAGLDEKPKGENPQY